MARLYREQKTVHGSKLMQLRVVSAKRYCQNRRLMIFAENERPLSEVTLQVSGEALQPKVTGVTRTSLSKLQPNYPDRRFSVTLLLTEIPVFIVVH
ncbi:MAG: hypothetical protein AAFY20_06795 [Cyanobacteria bacterium J06639_14]